MQEYNCSKQWLSETISGHFYGPLIISDIISNCSRCFIKYSGKCPPRNFGRHIVIALSVCQTRFVSGAYLPIFFEVGIPNLVCGCILGWRSVAYHFWVTVTLTSDLVFGIIVSGAYLILFEVGILKFGVWMHLEKRKRTIIRSLWPWTWPLT